eukprot:9520032-Lingulodinium_polyedra.AAC.1
MPWEGFAGTAGEIAARRRAPGTPKSTGRPPSTRHQRTGWLGRRALPLWRALRTCGPAGTRRTVRGGG